MRLGFCVSNHDDGDGGTTSFQRALLNELARVEFSHEVTLFTKGLVPSKECPQFETVNFAPPPPASTVNTQIKSLPILSTAHQKFRQIFPKTNVVSKSRSLLKTLTNQHKIDFLWFLGGYDPVDVPYAMTVFDLQHRLQPEFPEVRTFGWPWEEREEYYSHGIGKASYVIAGTNVGRDEILRFYAPNPDRVRVFPFFCPMGAKDLEPRPAPQLKVTSPYLFYPAQYWAHKNHVVVLHALSLLKQKHDLQLGVVFCGSDKGNLSHIKEIGQKLGVFEQIEFLPSVPRETLISLYQHAAALVFPTYFGPDNLPPLEAFAQRCPVIASRVSGAEEQLGDAALLFDPSSEEALVSQVLALMRDEKLKSMLIERGMSKLENRNTKTYVSTMLQVIEEFARRRRTWAY